MCYQCNPGGSYGSGAVPSYSPLESAISQSHYQASYSSSGNYTISHSISNSELEQAIETAPTTPMTANYIKNTQKYGNDLYLSNDSITRSYSSAPIFLKLHRPTTEFIDKAADIEEDVRKTFGLTTGREFPDDIIIKICDMHELKRVHKSIGGVWSNGISGFAVNRKKSGQGCVIFIKEDELARVMITVGHEIGHCLSNPLPDQRDEEAKAFAFELAWVEILHKHNIAGLSNCITPTIPANNGLHNIAFDFISSLTKRGKEAIELFTKLISGELSIKGDAA